MRQTIISCIAILFFACNAGKTINNLPVDSKPSSQNASPATPVQSNDAAGANANLFALPENKSLAGRVVITKKAATLSLPRKLRRPAIV